MLRLALGFGLVAVLGCLHLPDPIGGDQALFLVAAREIARGAVLYRDFWDLKGPGIFAFYLTAGRLGGFGPGVLHAVEVLWNLALAAIVWAWLRVRLERAALAIAAPLLVVGASYAVADESTLTQVEFLAGLPLVACAAATLSAFEAPRGRRAIALATAGGIAAGIAVVFKVLFAAIAVAMLATVLIRYRRAGLAAIWLAGALLPVAFAALAADRDGTLAELATTLFVLPARIVASVGHAPPSRLVESAWWFVVHFGYLVPLAGFGLAMAPDASARKRAARDVALAYFGAALVVIGMQVQSWWTYQFVLLVPPLGVLATLGVDAISERLGGASSRRSIAQVALACVALAFLPSGIAIAKSAARIVRDRPFASAAATERYRVRTSGGYARAAAIATYLETSEARRGGVYVAGDPRVYLLANRAQALPINGWALELYPPERWRALEGEFVAHAPRFVFIASDYAEIVRTRSHAISARLATTYAIARRTSDGTWYRARAGLRP